MTAPLLSIAIPTYNRASYLALTLEQLRTALSTVAPGSVEVIVSDNGSSDETPEIVDAAIARGLRVRSVRNTQNTGSDANIAQSFNLAMGRYVLILSDDDVLVPGALESLVRHLEQGRFGVVCLQPYGYSDDFEAEYPGGSGQDKIFKDAGAFLVAIGPYITLISACVVDKSLLEGVDARQFCGGNLVQVHLVIKAALRAREHLYSTQYAVACKRNNSGGYDFSKVFVEELGRILDQYTEEGLPIASVREFESHMLLGYYPYYLLRQRLGQTGDLSMTYERFAKRFKRRALFWFWVAPIIKLPRPLSIAWGGVAVAIGRVLSGDLRRGAAYAWSRLILRVFRQQRRRL